MFMNVKVIWEIQVTVF